MEFKRDLMEKLGSATVLIGFLLMVGLVIAAEMEAVMLRNKDIVMLVLGFLLREVGQLTIGRDTNGNKSGQ